ncbi:MAG: arginine--tRNA ligase [Candidatus Marinimicrobia bacterium]|nr:arginine--tRNA ligase [Candidatus Neomarinimicrobiota bacterium]
MLEELRNNIDKILDELGWEHADFHVERPRDRTFGHASSNVALTLAKVLKRPPRDIAAELTEKLENRIPGVDKIGIEGPGFINIYYSSSYFQAFIPRIRKEKELFQRDNSGKGKKVQVEFVSANPTGPLTIGHGRQAVLGDSIARILEWHGYDVTREYYFNDAGRQMRMLGESVYARYLQISGKKSGIPEGGYEGEYIADIARKFTEKYGEGHSDSDLQIFIDFASQQIFDTISGSLQRLNIFHDVYYNEKDLYENGKIDAVLKELDKKEYIYKKDGAVWFKAKEFGAEKDRVLVKSSGEPTYRLPDIAYHREKIRRGFDLIVDIFGADRSCNLSRCKSGTGSTGL